jgi:hypothetical protein
MTGLGKPGKQRCQILHKCFFYSGFISFNPFIIDSKKLVEYINCIINFH